MSITVEAPDGTEVEFPDGTSTDVMRSAMQRRFGGPKAPAPGGSDLSGLGNVAGAGMDALKGFGKSVGGTAIGALQAADSIMPGLPGTAPSRQGARELLAKGQDFMKPEGGVQEGAKLVGDVAQYFVPGAAEVDAGAILAKSSPALAAALRGAVEGGIIGSAQAGKAGLEQVLSGAAGGAVGHGIGKAVEGAGNFLTKTAPETFAKMIPRPAGKYHQDRVIQAISELLSEGGAVGDLSAVAAKSGARTDRLRAGTEAYKAGSAARTESVKPVLDAGVADAMEATNKGVNGAFVRNEKGFEQANAMLREVGQLQREYKGQIPRGVIEQKLADLDELVGFYKKNPGGNSGSNPDYIKQVAGRIRSLLNETDPIRPTVTEPHSRSLELTQALEEAASAARFGGNAPILDRNPAVTMAAGVLAGSGHPVAAGATAMARGGARSPSYLSRKAQGQFNIGSLLKQMDTPTLEALSKAIAEMTAPEEQ